MGLRKPMELIMEERHRQQTGEGFLPDRDDGYTSGELAQAAACYALPSRLREPRGRLSRGRTIVTPEAQAPRLWPWAWNWWKPTGDEPLDRIRELAKAGALIVAEMERLQRVHERMRPKYVPREHSWKPVEQFQGELSECSVCGSFEGATTSECPGAKMNAQQTDKVYRGMLDYRGGRWVHECSPHSPVAAARRQRAGQVGPR